MTQTVQPKNPVIDWSNPLTRGLLSAFSFAPGPIRDLVTGKTLEMRQHTGSGNPATAGSVVAPTFKTTKDGMGIDMGLRSGDVVWLRNSTGIFSLNSTTEYSRVIGIGDYSGGLGANPGLWRSADDSSWLDFDIVEGGDDDWYMRVGGTNRVINPFVGPVVEHQFHGLSFFADGSADLFVDGRLEAETTSAPDNFSSETVYNLGVQFNTTDALTGTWTFLAFWDRALQPTEMAAMTANPWQIFKSRELYIPMTPGDILITEEGNLVLITDVNTTESWTDGDTGLVITGSGFV